MYTDVQLRAVPAAAGEVTGPGVGGRPAARGREPAGGAASLAFLVAAAATAHLRFACQGEGASSAAPRGRPPMGTLFRMVRSFVTFYPFSSSFFLILRIKLREY